MITHGTDPAPGAVLLDDVAAHFARYVVTVSPADHDLLALWAVHTHLAVECYTSPRLQLDSPMPGSGKTTTLEHLARLCVRPLQMASVSSAALLTRVLANGLATLLIDEADRTLRPDKPETADLLAVLNSGYKRGASRPVLVPVKGGGWDTENMPTFAPVAIAGNQPKLPDDTLSRMIRVLLLPDLDGTAEESDWELIEDDTRELAERIATWAEQVREQVRTHRPVMPAGITGRFREKWAPLRRVADAAGGRWPALVDQLATADKEQMQMDKEDGLVRERPGVLLLRHLADVWPESDFVPTAALVADLAEAHPDVWGPGSPFGKALTVQRFGRMLAGNYKVHSTRLQNVGPRGYTRASLATAWSRLRIEARKRTGETGSTGPTGDSEPDKPVQPVPPVTPDTPAEAGNPCCQMCGKPNLYAPESIKRGICARCTRVLDTAAVHTETMKETE